MDRPSISVMSPTSPSTLRDLPLVLPGELSVSKEGLGLNFVSSGVTTFVEVTACQHLVGKAVV